MREPGLVQAPLQGLENRLTQHRGQALLSGTLGPPHRPALAACLNNTPGLLGRRGSCPAGMLGACGFLALQARCLWWEGWDAPNSCRPPDRLGLAVCLQACLGLGKLQSCLAGLLDAGGVSALQACCSRWGGWDAPDPCSPPHRLGLAVYFALRSRPWQRLRAL